jgi:hypothetical protein
MEPNDASGPGQQPPVSLEEPSQVLSGLYNNSLNFDEADTNGSSMVTRTSGVR